MERSVAWEIPKPLSSGVSSMKKLTASLLLSSHELSSMFCNHQSVVVWWKTEPEPSSHSSWQRNSGWLIWILSLGQWPAPSDGANGSMASSGELISPKRLH